MASMYHGNHTVYCVYYLLWFTILHICIHSSMTIISTVRITYVKVVVNS